MIQDMDYRQDDQTVILNRNGNLPADTPLTDFATIPKYAKLEERMVYAARARSSDSFDMGSNPVVTAAATLMSEVVRLKHSYEFEDLHNLQERLSAEIKLFEHRLVQQAVEGSQVMAARYVLCTALDEAVATTPWGNESEWSSMSLLSSFHNETFGGEKFFQLLDRLSRNPVKHLPLLELMYLCISLGFEGKYRVMPRGVAELEVIRDGLYRQIRQLRGDTPRDLSPHWQGLKGERHDLVTVTPWWVIVACTAVCLLTLYGGFAWVLAEQRERATEAFSMASPSPDSSSLVSRMN